MMQWRVDHLNPPPFPGGRSRSSSGPQSYAEARGSKLVAEIKPARSSPCTFPDGQFELSEVGEWRWGM